MKRLADIPIPDREITKTLKPAGKTLGISLLDHIIFNRKGHYSFLEHGEMEALYVIFSLLPVDAGDGARVDSLLDEIFGPSLGLDHLCDQRCVIELEYLRADVLAHAARDAFVFFYIDLPAHTASFLCVHTIEEEIIRSIRQESKRVDAP